MGVGRRGGEEEVDDSCFAPFTSILFLVSKKMHSCII